MPLFEYRCNACDVDFEELLLQSDDIRQYSQMHPCPQCRELSPRIASAVNFAFKAPPRQSAGSGVHGQSGVHDLDYPSVDKAVGRSASKRWDAANKRKAERDKVRKEAGTNAISVAGGQAAPISAEASKLRSMALSTFSAVKKSDGSA
jgi:putative FmdB family regulatory protein